MYRYKNNYTTPNRHDLGYKALTSERQICVDLVQSCIEEEWGKMIDTSYVEEVTNEFILPEFRMKKADKVLKMIMVKTIGQLIGTSRTC